MRRLLLPVLLVALAGVLVVVGVSAGGSSGDPRADRPTPTAAPAPESGPFALAAEGRGPDGADGSVSYPAIAEPRTYRATRRSTAPYRVTRRGRGRFGGAYDVRRRILRDVADRLGVTDARLRTALRGIRQRAMQRPFDPRTASPSQRVRLKERLLGDLASELGLEDREVERGLRAELAEKLRFATAFGMFTQRGRRLALACFDDPATCDIARIRAEVRPTAYHGGS